MTTCSKTLYKGALNGDTHLLISASSSCSWLEDILFNTGERGEKDLVAIIGWSLRTCLLANSSCSTLLNCRLHGKEGKI